MNKLILAAVLTLMSTANALAQGSGLDGLPGLELGEPTYAGSGCPAGSVATILSPERSKLSVLFDQFNVEAGLNAGRTVAQKNCSLGIPVRVPQGYSVAIAKIDYRGYLFVPRGANVRLQADYFYAGSRGPTTIRSFAGSRDESYLVTDNLIATSLVWSACGAETILRVNAGLRALTNRAQEDVLATLDSTDVDTGIIYQLTWKRCSR